MLSFVDLEERASTAHPLRTIKRLARLASLARLAQHPVVPAQRPHVRST
jgi:hypothetical protein